MIKNKNVYRVSLATQKDVTRLKGHLRKSDREEVTAALGLDPDIGLQKAFELSVLSWAAFWNGAPFLLFGASSFSTLSRTGVPWLIGTDVIDNNLSASLAVMRQTPKYLDILKSTFSFLENYVDARHTQAIRWVKAFGFTVEPPEIYGVGKLPFHRFWMKGY